VDYQHLLVIYSPNNSSVTDSAYHAKTEELVNFAKDKGIKHIQVVGHTSAPGKEDYNQWL
jgi:outer membrane protein OmpA-like peptidoglycan-associated protein